MRAKVFYPSCQWLDPNTRNTKGDFYCEERCRSVHPARSVYDADHKFNSSKCAPDCWHRRGKTRVPTL